MRQGEMDGRMKMLSFPLCDPHACQSCLLLPVAVSNPDPQNQVRHAVSPNGRHQRDNQSRGGGGGERVLRGKRERTEIEVDSGRQKDKKRHG